jgi:anti-anti-sigma factor
VADGTCPVQWTDRQAVVTLPERIDVSNSDKIREALLAVINQGATLLIADMTMTGSCDHGGADAVARAFQRAAVNGTQLRLVVTAQIVRRVLEINGLDRLISIYPSLEAATAAGMVIPLAPRQAVAGHSDGPAADDDHQAQPGVAEAVPLRYRAGEAWQRPQPAAITPAVLWRLIDALADGVALTDDSGGLALVNQRLVEMFGYGRGELTGKPVESLVPVDLRAAHAGYRADYLRAPRARPMGAGVRLVGLRKDGATFPVEVSLSPVQTATGHFTLAVVRDMTEIRQRQDLADLARAALEAVRETRARELLDSVVSSLFEVGLSLQEASDLPHAAARERIGTAISQLDLAIHDIRGHLFTARDQGLPPDGASPNGSG